MFYIHVPSGTEFDGDRPILLGEGELATNYPPGWFDHPDLRAELNVVERPYTAEELQAQQDAADAARIAAKAAYLVTVRDLRERILNRLAGIAAVAIATEDADTLTAFLAARQVLLGITTAPAVAAAQTAGEAKLAVKAVYAGIVAECPPVLKQAILTVDA
jgi:predicted RNA-binding Zn ribbon-like protein